MDGDSTLSIREVKMEDATPSNTNDGADSPSVAASKNASTAGGDAAKGKPYRSWKKKFQKMRVDFDVNMDVNEKLHTEEISALQTTKRLAVEIDRILDLLLDINNTPQIPGSKRIDLSLPRSKNAKALDIDSEGGWERRYVDKKNPGAPPPEAPARSLQSLLADVPHLDVAATAKKHPSRLKDLVVSADNKLAFAPPDLRGFQKKQQQHNAPPLYPESFLTADDIDNYLWDTDRNIAGRALLAGENPPPMLPTMAPFAHTPDTHIAHIGKGDMAWDELFNRSIVENDLPKMVNTTPFWYMSNTIARNPTSVYNWLKDHAPKAIFLQEGEATAQAAAAAAATAAAAAAEKEKEKDKDGADSYHHYSGAGQQGANGTSRKRRSAAAGGVEKIRGSRVSGASASGAGSRGGKRASGATSAISREVFASGADVDSDDLSPALATPRNAPSASAAMAAASGGRGGKRKRTMDDDSGYRPKGTEASASSTRANKRKRKSESGIAGEDVGAPVASVTKKRQRKSDVAAETAAGDTEVEAASDADEDPDVGDAASAADRDVSPVDA